MQQYVLAQKRGNQLLLLLIEMQLNLLERRSVQTYQGIHTCISNFNYSQLPFLNIHTAVETNEKTLPGMAHNSIKEAAICRRKHPPIFLKPLVLDSLGKNVTKAPVKND